MIANYEPSITLEPAVNMNAKQARDLSNYGSNYNPGKTSKSNEKAFINSQRKISGNVANANINQTRYKLGFMDTP